MILEDTFCRYTDLSFYRVFFLKVVEPRLRVYVTPFPNDKFWTLPNRKKLDDNFKSVENGRKFAKRIEINVGEGEIAHYEQFLLFPQ